MNRFDRPASGDDALREVQAKSWPMPKREAMLSQAYLRAEHTKEDSMTVIDRLFAGRPLVARLGIATALLTVLVLAAVLLPRPDYTQALAATEGVVLSYHISAISDPEPTVEKLRALKQTFQLPAGADLKIMARVEARSEQRSSGSPDGATRQVRVGEREGEITTAIVAVQLTGADEATLDSLRSAIATAAPEVGEPTVQNATWFREQGAGIEGGTTISLNIDGRDHTFNFPDNTSEEQMESEIRGWLASNHPGKVYTVDVNIEESGSGNEVRRQIQVRIQDDEHEK